MTPDRDSLRRRLQPLYFNSSTVDEVADRILALEPRWRGFVLEWALSVARTQPEIGYQFVRMAGPALAKVGREGCESWLQSALDVYFEHGLEPALQTLQNLDRFIVARRRKLRGLELHKVRGILRHFLHGLGGRQFGLEAGEDVFTDSETLFLPPVVDAFGNYRQDFDCFKAIAVHQWAQCRYGTWRADCIERIPREEPMLRTFHYLETLRLNACLRRDYPGLARLLQNLQPDTPAVWRPLEAELSDPASTVLDSIRLSALHWDRPRPAAFVYQGRLDPARVQQKLAARLEREKRELRLALARVLDQQGLLEAGDSDTGKPRLDLKNGRGSAPEFEFDGETLPPDAQVDNLLTSILQDLGEIPPQYLDAAGSAEYHASLAAAAPADSGDAARDPAHGRRDIYVYDEWDCTRRAHRKRWCTLREHEIEPDYDSDFVDETLRKYRGHIKSLRRSFEALRDEYRILKKQPQGGDLDFDALVEAIADVRSGMEMNERIYRKSHRAERSIAVIVMVDMSGSTQGWINTAQREALILLAEALASLDDRYAIYGFSGNTRKRCEIYRIKTFDETYGGEVRARIAAIEPQDYTRMGVTIRHLTHLLDQVGARAKLLITLSDGKPDDYDSYHGEYGIEDTRMALYEARRRGIHPFCITIDEEAREYLPHMYGDASYVLIDDAAKLPYRIADIYRTLTT